MRTAILLVLWVSLVGGVRYDHNNFTDISTGGFQIMPYSDVPPRYGIPAPPGGPDSGGAFLFDSSNYHCMKITEKMSSSLTVFISFWCDNNNPELKFHSCSTAVEIELCEGNAGRWTETRLHHACDAWSTRSEIKVCGNSLKEGYSAGYEYVEVYRGDVEKTTTTTTATTVDTSTTPAPSTTVTTPTTTVPTTTSSVPTTTTLSTTITTPTTTVPTTASDPPTTTVPTTTVPTTTSNPPTTTVPTTTSNPSTTTVPTTTSNPPTTTVPTTTVSTTTSTPTTTTVPTTTVPTTTSDPPTTTVPTTISNPPTTTVPTTTSDPPTTTVPTTTVSTTTSTPTTTTVLTTTVPTTTSDPPTTTVPTTTVSTTTSTPTTTTVPTTTSSPPMTTVSTTTSSTPTTTVPTTTSSPSTTTLSTTTSSIPTTTTDILTSTPLFTEEVSATTSAGNDMTILGISLFEFIALCLFSFIVLLVFITFFILLVFRRRKRRIYVKVVPNTPLPTIGGEVHTPVTQPTHPPEIIPRPMLRPSRSQQENKISHNSWVYGHDETDRRGVVMRDTDTYRHTDSSRHYINLNSNALHHDYGDVYSVTQDLDSHTGREYRQGHQQATNTLWRAAPWADVSTNYWRGDSPHRGHYRRYH